MIFVIMTDEGEVLGVATNEEIAIRKMIEYLTEYQERNHWFDTDEEFEEAIADVKLNLQAEGYLYAFPSPLWDV